MTEDQAREAISQAQDVLAKLGYRTFLLEVHIATVVDKIREDRPNLDDEDLASYVEEAWDNITNDVDRELEDIWEYTLDLAPEVDEE